MRFLRALLLASVLLLSSFTQPLQILIIRHAEKSGLKTDADLSPRGYAHAAALPGLFPVRFPAPDFLFASAASKRSNRPVETLLPLAKTLGLKIDNAFSNTDYKGIAKRVLGKPEYAGKNILICWHHTEIPALAHALGAADAPAKWPAQQFDWIWRIEYTNGAAVFTQIDQ